MGQCFFCNSNKSVASYYPKIKFNDKNFEYRECKDCGLVYIDPVLNPQDLEKLYSLEYHDEFYFQPGKTYEKQEALLKKYKPGGKLLDYGCGDASFLRFFRNKNYTLTGAEYNPALVDKLKEDYPDIHFKSISSLLEEDNEKYDIIHLGDVLEHLVNPGEIISALREKLLPGGVLFVEGPIEHNFNLAYTTRAAYFTIRKWMQPQRRVYLRPFHVLFANRKNQKAFFENSGFKTLTFQLFEWAWPFPDNWERATTLKLKGEYLIGKLSVAGSRLVDSWGNRFYYIGEARTKT